MCFVKKLVYEKFSENREIASCPSRLQHAYFQITQHRKMQPKGLGACDCSELLHKSRDKKQLYSNVYNAAAVLPAHCFGPSASVLT